VDESAEEVEAVNIAPNETTTRQRARIVIDELETEVVIGVKKKKVNIRQAKLNVMGLTDVKKNGENKMKRLNIPKVRFRRRCRLKREIRTLQIELDKYLSNKDGTSKMKKLRQQLTQRCPEERSNLRVEFRMMKQNLWVNPRA
jgi:hypothetical protein